MYIYYTAYCIVNVSFVRVLCCVWSTAWKYMYTCIIILHSTIVVLSCVCCIMFDVLHAHMCNCIHILHITLVIFHCVCYVVFNLLCCRTWAFASLYCIIPYECFLLCVALLFKLRYTHICILVLLYCYYIRNISCYAWCCL